ncbi:hypothetical protein Tco_0730157 [Tanacetum coccineum]|uniref:Reverse transcriptase domain-containing protein n=1 Tax=Tanacetum coccineum TaxID=301880 RepID=A0ABQ4YS79_9ASTR
MFCLVLMGLEGTKEDHDSQYYPMAEIKDVEIELWNLKVKGTDVATYTLRFQELALMCVRMFHEESDEVEKYIGGLLDMIRGNVMSYQPKTMEKAIEFANDQMDQKVLTIAKRQAEQKRKLEFNARNNQGHQQQNKSNRYASILFDTGADRSFVSTTFSSLIDITPTTLDHYYDVELADGKIIGINHFQMG